MGCGDWAGFFRRLHPGCLSQKRPSVNVADSTPIQAEVAFGSSFAPRKVVLKVKRPFRLVHIPQMHAVLMAAVSRAKVEDHGQWVSARMTAELLNAVDTGRPEQDFLTWCQQSANGVSHLEEKWHKLFFWVGWALDNAEKRAVDSWDGDGSFVFSYFELCAHGCSIPEHKAFDNFVASREDPVWQSLWPPNDWLCACTPMSLLQSEGESRTNNQRGEDRIDPKLSTRALSWYRRSPRAAMNAVFRD